jgi:pilus assembly protein Flp/PilA
VLNLFTALQTLAFTVSDRIKSEEKGASAVEYALLIAVIAAVVVTGVGVLGDEIKALFQGISIDAPAPKS